MIESGMIEKPGSPDMPEVDERPRTGGVTLGQRTKEGHEMTMKRQKFWADAMEKAQVTLVIDFTLMTMLARDRPRNQQIAHSRRVLTIQKCPDGSFDSRI